MPTAKRGISIKRNGEYWTNEEIGALIRLAFNYEIHLSEAARQGRTVNEKALVVEAYRQLHRTPDAIRLKLKYIAEWAKKFENMHDRVRHRDERGVA